MTGKLAGRAAIVTGAAQGLGRAIAERFVAEGARVLIADRNAEKAAETAAAMEQPSFRVDVSIKAEIDAMIAHAVDGFGGLDILVNNAGVFDGAGLFDISEADFDRVTAINVKSVLFATQAAGRHMMARGAGSIINLASLAAVLAAPTAIAYCTTKGAVMQLTNASAIALAPHGVRVNGIGPGTIDTEMARSAYLNEETNRAIKARTPLGRMGRAEEVAGVALFLASDDSAYVTGKTIFVDGGRMGLNLMMPQG